MKKTVSISVSREFYNENFLKQSEKSKDIKHYRRLLGMHYLQQGKSHTEVSHLLGVSRSSVQNWLYRYKSGGLPKLESKSPPGRASLVDAKTLLAFKKEFLLKQSNLKEGRLTGKDAQKILKEKFGLVYRRSGIYKLLHKCGLNYANERV